MRLKWFGTDDADGRTAAALLAAAALLVAFGTAAWWFLGSDRRLGPAAPAATPSRDKARPPDAVPPPFFVKGTLISREGRAAIISVRQADGGERADQKVAEGETLDGYHLTNINMHQVYFEKDGARFMLVVGANRARPLAPDEPIVPQRTRVPDMKIMTPPPDVDMDRARRDVEQLIEHMRQSPKVQERLQQRQLEERQAQELSGAVPP